MKDKLSIIKTFLSNKLVFNILRNGEKIIYLMNKI